MTGLIQTLSDLKIIAATDRRVWAAGAFIALVAVTWVSTGSWREEEEATLEKYVRIPNKPEKVENMVEEFNKSMRESAEEHKFLKDYLSRLTNQFKADKEEIDWHVNLLVTKLGDMTEKVDDLTNKVGRIKIKKVLFEQKLKRQKKHRQKKRSVKSHEM